jgi:vancomycin aglycone glucosyltransferase
MIEGTVATQFETISAAAQGCDVIVGATALQVAAPSIAEKLRAYASKLRVETSQKAP